MNNFLLNGVDVCVSELTQRSFRAVPCELLVVVTPKNLGQAISKFGKESGFSGLRVSGVKDLGFLTELPNLRYLEVVNQPKVNLQPLDSLSNLRGLRIETPGTGLDFSCFPELEVFKGDWHPDNSRVNRCQELRQIRAWQFKPKSQDLSDLADTTRLEILELTQTSISSLRGIETLQDLRYCDISYAPKLESLDVLASDGIDLRELSFQQCKNLSSYKPLASLRRLRRLRLSKCAPMPDLKWTTGLNLLDFLSIVETNVEDGDLSPLLKLPRLRYVGTMDKKHYSHKFQQLNDMLQQRFVTD